MQQILDLPVRASPRFQLSLRSLTCHRRDFHKLSRVPRRMRGRKTFVREAMTRIYDTWSQEQLIMRIQELERQLEPVNNNEHFKLENATSATISHVPVLPTTQPIAFRKAPKPPPKAFDASKYSTRLIALKFAYLGQKYNGFEHHRNNSTPLPTIEEELWKALVKTRLINPTPTQGFETDFNRVDRKTLRAWNIEGADVNWDGCEYSKCGRTDRGVSAFGQVIGVRVRSSRKLSVKQSDELAQIDEGLLNGDSSEEPVHVQEEVVSKNEITAQDKISLQEQVASSNSVNEESQMPSQPFNDLTDELPYIQLLNRVLPPEIRTYAWCPKPPPDFSARFSCKERRYKYFFTNPSFAPVPGSSGLYNTANSSSTPMREGWLDIAAMKAGCAHLIGLHDFRNFCKIDASKQLTNFKRRIYHADIEEVSPLCIPAILSHTALHAPSPAETPKTYAFVLHGSAFLWHQVRSIVAILFLIGQNLESPSLIPALLDVATNPTRPKYEMASEAPLVLWNCIFPAAEEVQSAEERETGYEDSLDWIYVGDPGGLEPKNQLPSEGGKSPAAKGKWGRGGIVDDVWEVWRGHKIDETLAALLLDKIVREGRTTLDKEEDGREVGMVKGGPRLFDGGDVGRAKGVYVPVLSRERQEPVEVVNERYARRKKWDIGGGRAHDEDADG